MPDSPHESEIRTALQQWGSGQQQPAIDSLRPVADSGDEDAIVLVAWMFGALGRPLEGIEYARMAADLGCVSAIANYGPNLLSQQHWVEGIEMFRRALAMGWPHDPFGYAQQAAQQGPPGTVAEILKLARTTSNEVAADAVEQYAARARESFATIEGHVASSDETRQKAAEAIDRDATHIAAERQRVTALVDDVTKLVHGAAAEHLAQEYANHANDTEDTAKRYTRAATGAGIVAAVASITIAIVGLSGGHDVGSILSKGLLTLPVVALAGYFGGLARSHRRMAWHWRHVELQIRTAEPYLAPLNDDARKTMLAALALRFFPGQAINPQGGDAEAASDTSQIVAALTKESTPLLDQAVPPT